jgi:hypothetical protein
VTGAEMFKLPSDANDPTDPNYIPQYVACYDSDPNAYVVLTAQLDPPSNDPELLAMLEWTNGDLFPNNPLKRRVRLDQPNKTRVTATLGDVSVSADVWVVQLNSMTIEDVANPSFTRTNPPDANDLYVPEDENGQARVEISADVAPSDAGRFVSWTADGNSVDPNGGWLETDGTSGPVTLTPDPNGGDPTYSFTVGVDRNGDGEADCDALQLIVHVVGIEWFEIYDYHNPGAALKYPPDPNNQLFLVRGPNDVAKQPGVEFEVRVHPDSPEARRWVLWKAEGDIAEPSAGSFEEHSVDYTALTPTGGNYTYRISCGLDRNGNRSLETGEEFHYVWAHILEVRLRAVHMYGDGQHQLKKTGTENYAFDNQTFGDDGDVVITTPTWLDNNCNGDANEPGDVKDPVCFTKGSMVACSATLPIAPFLDFAVPGFARARTDTGIFFEGPVVLEGDRLVIVEPSFYDFPNQVEAWRVSVQWDICVHGNEYVPVGKSTQLLFFTWGTPTGSSVTAARVHWATSVCGAASADTEEAIADAIGSWLAVKDPPWEPGEKQAVGQGWGLLDANVDLYGECDEQAGLMALAMMMLGIEAEVRFVCASTDGGVGNCLFPPEDRPGPHYLILDFEPSGEQHNWNAFEGCCVTAGYYYSVWPPFKATDDYDMLKNKLRPKGDHVRQFWVRTNDDEVPGTPEWLPVMDVFEEVPLPD